MRFNWVVLTAGLLSVVTLRDDNLHLHPDVDWIKQESMLGHDLAQLLQTIYQRRSRSPQFYVSQVRNVGNPMFEHELPYPNLRFPDAGYQLLALYRFWNIVEYWYPNRNVLDQSWDGVLAEFIPKMALAKTKDDYQLEMIALIAKVTDTHANLWSAPPQSRPPAGTCQLPVTTRFIENHRILHARAAAFLDINPQVFSGVLRFLKQRFDLLSRACGETHHRFGCDIGVHI